MIFNNLTLILHVKICYRNKGEGHTENIDKKWVQAYDQKFGDAHINLQYDNSMTIGYVKFLLNLCRIYKINLF